jgi:hypothetical protein
MLYSAFTANQIWHQPFLMSAIGTICRHFGARDFLTPCDSATITVTPYLAATGVSKRGHRVTLAARTATA